MKVNANLLKTIKVTQKVYCDTKLKMQQTVEAFLEKNNELASLKTSSSYQLSGGKEQMYLVTALDSKTFKDNHFRLIKLGFTSVCLKELGARVTDYHR